MFVKEAVSDLSSRGQKGKAHDVGFLGESFLAASRSAVCECDKLFSRALHPCCPDTSSFYEPRGG